MKNSSAIPWNHMVINHGKKILADEMLLQKFEKKGQQLQLSMRVINYPMGRKSSIANFILPDEPNQRLILENSDKMIEK